MEIITGVERRRRWRDEEKLRILAELDEPRARFVDVARRHEISRGLLWQWRDAQRRGMLVAEEPAFVPLRVVPELAAPALQAASAASTRVSRTTPCRRPSGCGGVAAATRPASPPHRTPIGLRRRADSRAEPGPAAAGWRSRLAACPCPPWPATPAPRTGAGRSARPHRRGRAGTVHVADTDEGAERSAGCGVLGVGDPLLPEPVGRSFAAVAFRSASSARCRASAARGRTLKGRTSPFASRAPTACAKSNLNDVPGFRSMHQQHTTNMRVPHNAYAVLACLKSHIFHGW
jgi:transposase